jgi:hypothetical protein
VNRKAQGIKRKKGGFFCTVQLIFIDEPNQFIKPFPYGKVAPFPSTMKNMTGGSPMCVAEY